jgi:outer membrane protein TolC
MECIYDNVTDAAERVSIAENNVDKAELRLSKSREALTKLQQSGTASAIDLQQAQEQVKIAQENVNKPHSCYQILKKLIMKHL